MTPAPPEPPPPPPSLSLGKKLLFSTVTTAVFLLGLNAGVEWLERRGLLETRRPDDVVRYVDEDLFAVNPDGKVKTTGRAEQMLVPSAFDAANQDGWRMFVLGESFALGSPYTWHGEGQEKPGGMASWIRADLTARYPEGVVEVINAAAGSIDSTMVRDIAVQTLARGPDVLFVAMCNNEGALPPAEVNRALHQLGGYRLLTSLLKPTVGADARPTFTAQNVQPDVIRRTFSNNVDTLIRVTRERGVKLLLATMPVNLRYEGNITGHAIGLNGVPITITQTDDPACIAAGRKHYEAGAYPEAIAALERCDEVADALRWIGLSRLALGEVEAARQALQTSVELSPRNRCRPSLNAILREKAASADHVRLVDLEARANHLSPDGIPGYNLFWDSCHMNWKGYYEMAQEALATLAAAGWGPGGPEHPEAVPSMEAQQKAFGLADIGREVPMAPLSEAPSSWRQRAPAGSPPGGGPPGGPARPSDAPPPPPAGQGPALAPVGPPLTGGAPPP